MAGRVDLMHDPNRPLWRFYGLDLKTGDLIGELTHAITAWSGAREFGGRGPMSATLDTRALSPEQRLRMITATRPAHTSILAERDGVYRADHIVWGRRPGLGEQDGVFELAGQEPVSALDRKILPRAVRWEGTGQFEMLRRLVNLAADNQADLAIAPDPGLPAGTPRDREYDRGDYNGQRLGELAAVEGGFDYWTDTLWQPGQPRRVMRWVRAASPFCDLDETAEVLSTASPAVDGRAPSGGGNVLSLDIEEDGTQAISQLLGIGGGEGPLRVQYLAEREPGDRFTDDGYPVFAATASWSDVTDPATIEGHARAELRARQVISASQIVIPADIKRSDAFTIGKRVTLRIAPCMSVPAGAQGTVRITSTAYAPVLNNSGAVEAVTLTVEGRLQLWG